MFGRCATHQYTGNPCHSGYRRNALNKMKMPVSPYRGVNIEIKQNMGKKCDLVPISANYPRFFSTLVSGSYAPVILKPRWFLRWVAGARCGHGMTRGGGVDKWTRDGGSATRCEATTSQCEWRQGLKMDTWGSVARECDVTTSLWSRGNQEEKVNAAHCKVDKRGQQRDNSRGSIEKKQ